MVGAMPDVSKKIEPKKRDDRRSNSEPVVTELVTDIHAQEPTEKNSKTPLTAANESSQFHAEYGYSSDRKNTIRLSDESQPQGCRNQANRCVVNPHGKKNRLVLEIRPRFGASGHAMVT